MQEHIHAISKYILDLSEIPSSDPLVHTADLHTDRIFLTERPPNPYELIPDASWNRLLKTAIRNKREADLDSLCLVMGSVNWEYKGKTVTSPLVLQPLDWKFNKVTQTVTVRYDDESALINPFVRHQLTKKYGTDPGEFPSTDPESLLTAIETELAKIAHTTVDTGFTAIGHYHHHRFLILRELELIRQTEDVSPLIQSILGNEVPENRTYPALPKGQLSPLDTDQLRVMEELASTNLVIQGPPGTGKSQVLTNIIGKRLLLDGLTLVVSEKRVALDVLVRKLRESGLDVFSYITHSQSQPTAFIRQLESAWKFLEEPSDIFTPSLRLSEQLTDNLQLLLDRLNSPGLMGGVSFETFRQLEASTDMEGAAFHSDTPDVREWLSARDTIQLLEQHAGSLAVFHPFQPALLRHPQSDRIVRQLQEEITWLDNTFGCKDMQELQSLYRLALRCQLIQNETAQLYFQLHGKPKALSRFEKARINYHTLADRIQLLSEEQHIWRTQPAISEVRSLLDALEKPQGFFAKRRLNRRLSVLFVHTHIDPETALRNRLKLYELQEEYLRLRATFADWGIHDPDTQLETAAYVLRQLQQELPNELNAAAQLPSEKRALLIQSTERIKTVLHECNRYLRQTPPIPFVTLWQNLPSLTRTLGELSSHLCTLPESVLRLLPASKTTLGLQASVLCSNRILRERQFPELAKYNGAVLRDKINNIVRTQNEESLNFRQEIIQKRKQQFYSYTEILRTPAAKLSPGQRKLKSKLKAGKAILVREFAKSRQHRPERELLETDARIWIELLLPIWLSTPSQTGKHFPMETELFQLVIFDEASQIPLPHAMGALQRSVQAVVAGDEQQMSPTSYFSGTISETDLLHQASWYWKKQTLRHHYRSKHPALIAFSNTHFYHNQLVAYPVAGVTNPLHLHYVSTGVYHDRINPEEAREVAAFLSALPEQTGVGVVAFSEQQLECIWQQCTPEVQDRLNRGMENDTCFFKALEQVQGDEADCIVISMGYGKNPEGRFLLRFGPLARANGDKRLNVLLTRAKSELHFFSSVTSADFPVSSNEPVNLLRLFLKQLEAGEAAQSTQFPYNLPEEAGKGTQMELPEIYTYIPDAMELVNFHRVMGQRGWKLSY